MSNLLQKSMFSAPLPQCAMFRLKSCHAALGILQVGGRGETTQNLGLSHIYIHDQSWTIKFETNSCRACSRNQDFQPPLPQCAMFSLKGCHAAPGILKVGGRGETAQNLGLSHIYVHDPSRTIKFETNSCRTCSRNQDFQTPLPQYAMFSLKGCHAAAGTLQVGGRRETAQNLGLSHILCP